MATNNAINLARGTFSTVMLTTVAAGGIVKFDTILVDETSSYNTTTGIFTVPFKGNWLFTTAIGLITISPAAILYDLAIHVDGFDYEFFNCNPTTCKDGAYGTLRTSGSIILPINAGQLVNINVSLDNTADIQGGNGTTYYTSTFCGTLLL